jgi:N-acetylmuramoyl-L-alanine amidase
LADLIKLIVIICAGHGGFGVTPGKRTPKLPNGKVMYEFDFNNPTAQYLGAALQAEYENVEVHYVHDLSGKTDVPLEVRTDKANDIYKKYEAEIEAGKVKIIYVSVHANGHGSGAEFTSGNGIETLVHHTKPKESVELAANVQNELIRDTGRKNRGIVYRNDLHVLNETKMTAIIAECGFMTNLEEANLLLRDDYRRKCANAIKVGIAKTFPLRVKTIKKASVVSATKKKEQVRLIIETNNVNAQKLAADFKSRGYKVSIEA